MVETGASALIDGPIREVFGCAVNPYQWPAWLPAESGVNWSASGALEVGATFLQIGTMADPGAQITWEVTQYEPPRVLACHRISDPRITIRLVFESIEGGTRITILVDDDGGTFNAGSTGGHSAAACLLDSLTRLASLFAGDSASRPEPE